MADYGGDLEKEMAALNKINEVLAQLVKAVKVVKQEVQVVPTVIFTTPPIMVLNQKKSLT